MSAPAHAALRTTPEDLEARISHHSIAPGRVAMMDLGMRSDESTTSGSDRPAAIGALLAAAVAVVAILIGLA